MCTFSPTNSHTDRYIHTHTRSHTHNHTHTHHTHTHTHIYIYIYIYMLKGARLKAFTCLPWETYLPQYSLAYKSFIA